MITLVYRSLSGMAPAYLAADCQLSSEEGRRQLRSARLDDLCRQVDLQQHWHRCFAAAISVSCDVARFLDLTSFK